MILMRRSADDLNTAMALGAAYDLVREANIAMDKGEFRQGDVAAAKSFWRDSIACLR